VWFVFASASAASTSKTRVGVFSCPWAGQRRGEQGLPRATAPSCSACGYKIASDLSITGNGDQRLQQIQNLKPGGANLSTFSYTYDVVGQIQTWSRQNDAAVALTSSFKYDSGGQLLTAAVPSSASMVKSYTYGYDLAGNRTQEQIDSGVTTSVHNNLNQLTGQTPGGQMEFSGTLSEPATLTLGGKPAAVDGSNNWIGRAAVVAGANAIPLTATDASGNATTKTITITVPGGAARTLTYDLNGNEIDNGAGRVTALDALNRPVKITIGANVIEFVYNGFGQRVQEKLNGTLIKQWIWDGGAQPAEERDPAGNVTKRFFGAGEQIGGINYYFTTDHLGSVREMTDSTGAIRARYEYDPYGRQTKVSGDLESDFGFTGFYRHQASGLNLTLYRAYDPELGRWISRDPIAEQGGLNLYAYVANNPLSLVDTFGLAYEITETQGLHYNDRSSKFGFKIVGDGFGGVRTAPMGGTHTYDVSRAEAILGRDLSNPAKGQQLRDMIRDSFEKPSFQSSETYMREVGGGLRRTMQNLALAAMVLSVVSVAARAETIAHNLMRDACDMKKGDDWAPIALHEDMQELAPGMAGHWAWLVTMGGSELAKGNKKRGH
jgi:RHS repeat-associated protein